ncbi:Hypothetical protein LUCI_4663 [Lucifera butyrica]|uniref:Uncharacterized protein n=1 Tax=Lucifera butyrica TaxID=1351585 RepID=A0A498RGY6_9FIRM|nr:hypothetical protein [Lucifera butyrica]VBB09373.1 Hypothetical protein LUCI_4663 [Lucifera butyrica]
MEIDSGKFRYIVGMCSIIGGILFNLTETWYFGWHLKPQLPAEMICDYIAQVAIVSGSLIVGYVIMFQGGNKDKEA